MSLPKGVTFTSKAQIKSLVKYMNKQYSNIKLTFEVKQNNTFSCLDIIICHEYNKFTTLAYRKPPFSGVFTYFASFILLSSKFALREKCPNAEFFLLRIFSYSFQIRENTDRENFVFGHFFT